MEQKEFLGRGWKFPLAVDKRTGKIAMVEYEDDIKEAIGIIIKTHLGERVMRSDFGSRAFECLFESNSTGFELQMKNSVEEALVMCEPRIKDVEVSLAPDSDREGTALITVGYTVRSTNNYFNMVYPFYLMEGIET